MIENQPTEILAISDVHKKVQEMHDNGYRLVQIHCTTLENFELNYTFDKDYQFLNFRIEVTKEQEIQSVSDIYWMAMLYENEIHDLFGLKFNGLAVDFGGNLYKTTIKQPFATNSKA